MAVGHNAQLALLVTVNANQYQRDVPSWLPVFTRNTNVQKSKTVAVFVTMAPTMTWGGRTYRSGSDSDNLVVNPAIYDQFPVLTYNILCRIMGVIYWNRSCCQTIHAQSYKILLLFFYLCSSLREHPLPHPLPGPSQITEPGRGSITAVY